MVKFCCCNAQPESKVKDTAVGPQLQPVADEEEAEVHQEDESAENNPEEGVASDTPQAPAIKKASAEKVSSQTLPWTDSFH